MRIPKREDFHWEDNKLVFQERTVCSLVPCKEYKDFWHLKFYWRDEPTPEFFNIVNARENARVYCRRHEEETLYAASQSDLND